MIVEHIETTAVEASTVDLLAAVKQANRATGAKHTPALSFVRVRTVEGNLEVSAFNWDTSIVKRLPVTGEVESVYVVGAALATALTRLDKGLVNLTVEAGRLVLAQGSKRVALTGLDNPEDAYPALPKVPEGHDFSVSGANLALIADKLTPFAGRDDMLPLLTGVSLSLTGDTVEAMVTDRFRAAIMPVVVETNTDQSVKALVPNMTDVGAVFADSDRVDVRVKDSTIYLTSESSTMTVRLLDGEFPRLRNLFPTDLATSVTFDGATFIKSVKFAATGLARNTALGVETNGAGVTLTGDSDDGATMTDVVESALTGDGVDTGFNPDFLISAVKVFGKGEVTMGSTSGTKPSVFTSESVPNLRVLLMPRRRTS